MDMSYIGKRIRLRRNELNMTIAQVSEITGISRGNLSELETGKKLPSATALISLSNILNCSIDWLLKEKASLEGVLKSDNPLSIMEQNLIREFKQLNQFDQKEIYEIVKLKNKLKRDSGTEILSNSHQNDDSKLA